MKIKRFSSPETQKSLQGVKKRNDADLDRYNAIKSEAGFIQIL